MIDYNIEEIHNANSIDFDEALKKYPKYASVIKKLNSLTDYGRYDVAEIQFDEVQEKLVPYWAVTDDYSSQYYIFLDKSKKHVATIEDIAKIKPLNADTLNSNSRWRVYNVKDELSKKHTASAKKDNMIILDVSSDVFNLYHDVKQQDIAPFDVLVKAFEQWTKKAIKDKNTEALANALRKIYDEYDIKTSKFKGSWKKTIKQ